MRRHPTVSERPTQIAVGETHVTGWSESRMREIRTSGSTSGDVETEHGRTIEAPVTKGPEPARSCLNHRATPRLYY